MTKLAINIGTAPNDGTGDPVRVAFDKTNQNFTELYAGIGGGSYLPITGGTLTGDLEIQTPHLMSLGPKVDLYPVDYTTPYISLVTNGNDAWGVNALEAITYSNNVATMPIIMGKSRSDTAGAHGRVQPDDALFYFSGYGSDGANWLWSGSLRLRVDGATAAGQIPTKWVFETRGLTGNPVPRMTIDSKGLLTVVPSIQNGPCINLDNFGGTPYSPVLMSGSGGSLSITRKDMATNSNSTYAEIGVIAGGSYAGVNIGTSGVYGWAHVDGGAGAFYAVQTSLRREVAGIVGLRHWFSGASPASFRVYNSHDNGVDPVNYERGVFDWTTNPDILTIGTQKGGSGTSRGMKLSSANGKITFDPNTSFTMGAEDGYIGMHFNANGSIQISPTPGGSIDISDKITNRGQLIFAGTIRLGTYNDYNGSLALSCGNDTSQPSAFHVYNIADTWLNAVNYERGIFDWKTQANILTIGAQKGGTGVVRSVNIVGSALAFNGKSITPITVGTTAPSSPATGDLWMDTN